MRGDFLQGRRSAVFTGSQAAPITVSAARQASMFDFIHVARASCGDGTALGSASEPGEGGQQPGRGGPAASGPVHICTSASPVSPRNALPALPPLSRDCVSRGENAPPSAGQAVPCVQSYACPTGSRGHLGGPDTAVYVAACRDELPCVFSESATQPCPLRTPHFPVAVTSRGTDLGHGLVLANVRTPRANPQGTERTLLASQSQSRGGCRGAELRLRAASARLSPVRTACGAVSPGWGLVSVCPRGRLSELPRVGGGFRRTPPI